MPGSAAGIAWCDDAGLPGSKCDQHYIRIEPSAYHEGVVCHEAGHAVGLLHGEDAAPALNDSHPALGCMRKPIGLGMTLGANNRSQINSNY
ncbi:hypothetical protein ACIBCM_30155 [Streptomyces sp. NPDC051018]|uniref:hypothetical protein n=1 Tax=Streptomyces sp. NPDC051018 TaxID=3365639 RepID=UPI0037AB2E35